MPWDIVEERPPGRRAYTASGIEGNEEKTMKRRDFLKLAAVGACAGMLHSRSMAANGAGGKRPNILFFLADDQRNDTLGCAGHDIVKTPNIDRLASQGLRFRNAFVSTAICMVSRANILTGMTGLSHCVLTNPPRVKPEAIPTMYPFELRKAGYRCGYVGKWHVRSEGFKPESAFDYYEQIFRNPYFKPQPDGTKRHTAELIGDHAIEFLQGQSKDQPFCLSIGFNIGHAEDRDKRPGIGHFPWPKAVDGLYEDVEIPSPRLGDPAIYENQPLFLKQSINRERFFWRWDTPEKYQINMRAYFRMLTGMDRVIGRVLAELEARGLADNTIIVYSADNGYYMGDRQFAGKWSHYEQSLRVPLIIYDPRLPEAQRGRVVDPMALNLDLPSTFLDWAGVAEPECYQGRSLVPIVKGETPEDWRKEFYCEHLQLAPTLTWQGVRGERYVYARYHDQEPGYEFLHDLENDPDQLQNLATDPEHADLLAKMRKRCDAWVKEYGGPMPPLDQRPTRPLFKEK